MIHWSAFSDKLAQKRFGFMSQVSPDGKDVITSIDVPANMEHAWSTGSTTDSSSTMGSGRCSFRRGGAGVVQQGDWHIACRCRERTIRNFVQTSAFWSPGRQVSDLLARSGEGSVCDGTSAGARTPTIPTRRRFSTTSIEIPFNDGKGGKAEKLMGASENGMSNNFPRSRRTASGSCLCADKNGLLMRPDSQLYIVPFTGGPARMLNCNLKPMNSWHSWSPNGRWLVFSSKTPSLYTQMYLTHIDENGNDTPAILIEHATESNRAVNIPEFMNIAPGGLEKIDAPATEFYRLFDVAVQLADKKQYDAAVPAWKQALALAPEDPRGHNNLGIALVATGKFDEAVVEYRKSLELNPSSSQTHNNLGSALAEMGRVDEALPEFQKSVELNPDNGAARVNLGNALAAAGRHLDEAIQQLNKGIELQPESASAQNGLGVALARAGRLDDAVLHMEKAVTLAPQAADYRYNFGRVLAAKGDLPAAVVQFEEAAKLTAMQEPVILEMLAATYSDTGRYSEAVSTARRALELATRQPNDALAARLKASLARYEGLARSGTGPTATP